jgi:pantetheine-phosphate adenylyltransferase
MNGTIAVYPGTFDPITRGHEDLVRRAGEMFDKVIVGVAESRSKRPFFETAERVDMAREILAAYPNVEVRGFSCLLMDFLTVCDARIIVRGLRAVSDFEYEFQMAGMNRSLRPDVETSVPHAGGSVHVHFGDHGARDRIAGGRREQVRAAIGAGADKRKGCGNAWR